MSDRGDRVASLYPVALVAFSGATDLRWLRLLRPGYRHVFVALNDGTRWITVDPLSHRTEVVVQPAGAAFDLAAHYRQRGLLVVEVAPPPVPPRPAPPALFTCVEGVKRVLGIHAPFVLTPWQLYRHLERHARAPRPHHRPKRTCTMIDRILSYIADAWRSRMRRLSHAWRSAVAWIVRLPSRLTAAAKALFH